MTIKPSSIKRKLTMRVILIGIATFTVSIAFLYIAIVPGLRRDVILSTNKANEEIVLLFDNLTAYVKGYTESLVLFSAENENIVEYFNDPGEIYYHRAKLDLSNLVSNEAFIRCVIIENEDAFVLDSLLGIVGADHALLESEWYLQLGALDYAESFSTIYSIEWNKQIIHTAAYLKNFYINNQRFTYTVFFNVSDVLQSAAFIAADNFDDYIMFDATGKPFFSSADERWVGSVSAYLEESEGHTATFINLPDVKNGALLELTSINTGLRIVSYITNQRIFSSFRNQLFSIFIIMTVFLLITVIYLPKSLSRVVKPIATLSQAMSTAEINDWKADIQISSEDEIGDLSRSFNKMLVDLRHSFDLITEKEKQDQMNKFSLLVSQINPHFIYNTLNSINYLARQNRVEDITVVNKALISILQDRLRVSSIEITDTLENEIKVVEQYISIQRYTYGGELEVCWNIDETLSGKLVPKNMIQPLVENAIFHGLLDEETGELNGKIEISAAMDGDALRIVVSDDGYGFPEEMLIEPEEPVLGLLSNERGKRIGLTNIRGRLYYLYGSGDGLSVENKPGGGAQVTLTLAGPLLDTTQDPEGI